jgi:hypothetical protein
MPPIVDTPVEPNSAASHHSLQHIDGYVGRFFLNVSFQVLQSLWAVGLDTGFQTPPQKKSHGVKSGERAGHSKSPLSEMRRPGK